MRHAFTGAPRAKAYASDARKRGGGGAASNTAAAGNGKHRIVFPAGSLNSRRPGETGLSSVGLQCHGFRRRS